MDTGAAGGNMVFVKVRETYDLHTVRNKMTVIAIHTPHPDIIKRNYPGLLMQCKAYRPYSADVRVACASVMPLDPQGVGTADGDVAPEDVFNPILYKAMSNFGMSQLEARINGMLQGNHGGVQPSVDVAGDTADVDVDTVTTEDDEFPVYYGLLSETHSWKHAAPQSGLSMSGLKPLVWEMVYNFGDNTGTAYEGITYPGTYNEQPSVISAAVQSIRGGSKSMPFINCTAYTGSSGAQAPGFITEPAGIGNYAQNVPWINVVVGAIIVPPSRLHEMFYRMVVEWTIEFSQIRSLQDIQSFYTLGLIGGAQHYQNYDYSAAKVALTGTRDTILENDSCMVSANVDVEKVM